MTYYPYYHAVPAVVGTTSSCDMTGFEASGPEVQVNGASKKG